MTMSEFFRDIMSMESPFNMVVLIVLFGCVAGVLSTIVKQIRKYACHRHEMELKRELVERGLSAEEIQRIVLDKPGIGTPDDSS
jgi:hypothetical protein